MRRALLAAVAAAFVLGPAPSSTATPAPPRHVALFLVSTMSFERFMAVPEFRSLARAGGAALLSPNVPHGDRGLGPYVTLGAGARSAVSSQTYETTITSRGTDAIDVTEMVAENRYRSTPGLLGSVLRSHGLVACASAGSAALVAMDRGGRTVTAGSPIASNCALTVYDITSLPSTDAGSAVRRLSGAGGKLTVIVLEPTPSTTMRSVGDEVTPIAIATGTPSRLFDARGPMHTLTSDTTRLDGVVSNEDVAPTILHAFGLPVPSEMNGSSIRVIDEDPPFTLHRRHLEQRRLTLPIQLAVELSVTILGLMAIFILWRKPRWLPPAVASNAGVISLVIAPVAIASLAAGGLPHITYPWVIPFLVLVPLAAALAALRLRRRGTFVPALAVATAVLAFFVVEALQSWTDRLTTLSGGAALDGVRFYGMGNVEIGKILGASLWIAAVLPPFSGFVLLVAAGLYCGFPDLGANFGAAITLFAAAGLWLPLRSRGTLRWRELLFALGVVVAGLALVVGANLIWSNAPTHGARFMENAPGRGWPGLLHFAGERLATGWRLLIHAPAVWIPVVGLFLQLYVVLRPGPVLRDAFSRYPSWRDAVLVTILASMVALVVNDSGAAAASWGFGLAAAGIFYVPLVEETWRRAQGTVTAPPR